jgi:hypothetical protein
MNYPMATPTSVSQIDLTPVAGKRYFTLQREWRDKDGDRVIVLGT